MVEKEESKKKRTKCEELHHILIISFCLFFMITMLVIEVKDWTHDYRYQMDYGTQSELEAINWSGDIDDLRYCHTFFYVTINHTVKDYAFTWDYDCQSVKDNCDYYPDDCYFSVENNIIGEYGKNKLYQYFDGRCYCHINRDYKNMILDK